LLSFQNELVGHRPILGCRLLVMILGQGRWREHGWGPEEAKELYVKVTLSSKVTQTPSCPWNPSCPYHLLGGYRAHVDIATASVARGEVFDSIVPADRVEDRIRARAIPPAGRRLRMYRT
jgi:hypothetical protein